MPPMAGQPCPGQCGSLPTGTRGCRPAGDRLAILVGVGAGQVVSRWERGLQIPRLNTAAAIAEALVRDVGQESQAGAYAGRVAALVEQLPVAQAHAVLMWARNPVDGGA